MGSYADTHPDNLLREQYRQIIKASLQKNTPPNFIKPYSPYEQTTLTQLYQLGHHQLLWFNDEHPVQNINQLLDFFTQAPTYGLVASDYASQFLKQRWQSIQQSNPNITVFAQFDISLSLHLIRFINDLHDGRIPPSQIGFELPNQPEITASTLFYAIYHHTLPQLIKDSEPQTQRYQQLKHALAHYRQLAKRIHSQPYFSFKLPLRLGDVSEQIGELNAYLDIINNKINTTTQTSQTFTTNIYTAPIVAKIQTLQTQHHLVPDGIIGKKTLAVLNTPFKQRIEQIELSLERLRWLPKQTQERSIFVNIPAFQLWAYSNQQLKLTMKVIVGKAFNTVRHANNLSIKAYHKERKALRTPIFSEPLRYLIFNPYWNIPKNIVKRDILPQLEKHPDYLEKHNMEIVTDFSPTTQIFANTPENIAQLAINQLHLRQRPEKNNALGRIKFIFPNHHSIYLHDTPAIGLFKRTKRDLSHGCIRVANPIRLAQFILQGENLNWTEKTSQSLLNKTSQRITINQLIPVTLFYNTVFATNSEISFYPDLYGYDPILKKALKQHSQQRQIKPNQSSV